MYIDVVTLVTTYECHFNTQHMGKSFDEDFILLIPYGGKCWSSSYTEHKTFGGLHFVISPMPMYS